MTAMDDVVVARIGKPHGLKGEVTVRLHTDAPDDRFVVGAVFRTAPPARGPASPPTGPVRPRTIRFLSTGSSA